MHKWIFFQPLYRGSSQCQQSSAASAKNKQTKHSKFWKHTRFLNVKRLGLYSSTQHRTQSWLIRPRSSVPGSRCSTARLPSYNSSAGRSWWLRSWEPGVYWGCEKAHTGWGSDSPHTGTSLHNRICPYDWWAESQPPTHTRQHWNVWECWGRLTHPC